MQKRNIFLAAVLAACLAVSCVAALMLEIPEDISADTPTARLIFSEICARNESIITDNAGRYRDYIEIYNPGEDLNLAGYVLTDGSFKSAPLGEFWIPGGGYRILFLGDENVGFGLASSGDCIQLLDPLGRIVVQTNTAAMGTDQVMLYDNGTYLLSAHASPGFPNSMEGVTAFREGSVSNDLPLVISEVLAQNSSSLPDEQGRYCDVVELYNRSDSPVRLGGWCLSDSVRQRLCWRLPDVTLQSGEYLLIFCDGDSYVSDSGTVHAGFGLSLGETLCLTDPTGSYSLLDISFPGEDTSLSLTENDTYEAADVSLGYPNTEEGSLLFAQSRVNQQAELAISELLLSSAGVPYEGAFRDVVEIRNISSQAVSTEGWYLSDGGDPYAYALPQKQLKPGECLVVICDKETTGFGLSRGEYLRLTGPDYRHGPLLSCNVQEMYKSIALLEGDTAYTCAPVSLGYPNTDEGQGLYAEKQAPQGLMLSEVMTGNRSYLPGAYGTTCDWVELYNPTKKDILLSDYYLSDDPDELRTYSLPAVTLAPGEYYVILLSEDSHNLRKGYEVLPISLSSEGEGLYLSDNANITDYLLIPQLEIDTAWGRKDDLTAQLARPTPGESNANIVTYSAVPQAVTAQGVYDDVEYVDVVLKGNGDIYYTTDCTAPNKRDTRYTGPIRLTQTTVIRAICIEDGKRASQVLDLTYLINEND